jgi:hypothetical protein
MVVVIGAAAVIVVANRSGGRTPSKAGVTDNASATAVATVASKTLTAKTKLSGTLGYAGSYTVVNQATGASTPGKSKRSSSAAPATFTWLPAVGQIIAEGQTLYDVSGSPVVLLYGSTPAYRSLSEGMTGADVQQLNADLVALGYSYDAAVDASSDDFSAATKYALELFQERLGIKETGELALGQAIFLPKAIRVTSRTATLGGIAQAGGTILDASSTARHVSIALDASEQSEVKKGDKVTIVLPNNRRTPGVISSVGTTVSSGSKPTITVLVKPTHPAATGTWDNASVDVNITTSIVRHALIVPVDALLASASGGYAVEVVTATGIHELVPVSLGMFDDASGVVQVTDTHLQVGEKVVVPSL